ncbi:hypothetical protein LTS18_004770, partial [Coniosporium uncinatum]
MNVEVIPRPVSDRLRPFLSYVFEVPLANTVFQNGRAATLFSSQWKKFSGTTELRHIQSWPLRNLTVPANCFVTEEGRVRPGQGRNHAYSIPLVPLTAPKKIAAGMGNIIRQLEGVDGRDTTIPASSELESAVSAFFRVRDEAPHPMAVWALVLPSETFETHLSFIVSQISRGTGRLKSNKDCQHFWSRDTLQWHQGIFLAIQNGGSLHRVLSGGGGWGKKAGLLALDPDCSFSSDRPSSDDPFGFELDPDEAKEQAMGDVASPGKYVQFFTTVDEQTDSTPPEALQSLRKLSFDIGTIPSRIDELPHEGSPLLNEPAKLEAFRAHFGMLSEKGVSLLVRRHDPQSGEITEVVRTKVDVAYSRYSIQGVDPPPLGAQVVDIKASSDTAGPGSLPNTTSATNPRPISR